MRIRRPTGRLSGLFASMTLVLAGCGADPQRLLDEMGSAYRGAARYSDDARVRVRRTQGSDVSESEHPFRVAFARPDAMRIEAYDARVVSNGTTLFAAVGTVPGQVLDEPVRSPLALEQIFADDVLRATLTEGEAGCPTQLPLLLADDTVALILADAAGPPRIVGVETVDGHACHHLEIVKPDGVLGLWIDRGTRVLRRMRVPTAAYAAELARQAGVPVGLTVDVEFTSASFEADVPPGAFAFDVPPAARTVSRFEPLEPPQPPHPRLGTPAGLPPLRTLDGVRIVPGSPTDGTLVLDFFFEGCRPAARSLPRVADGIATFRTAHARAHGGESPAVTHVAVSLDPDTVDATAVRRTLAGFGGVGVVARDPQGVSAQALGIESFPATVVIDRDGRIADVVVGDHARIAADLADTLAALEAGADAAAAVRIRHERRIRDYRRDLERSAAGSAAVPEQVIAPRRQPVRFKLEPAWRAAGVSLPGNLLCLDATHGLADPRIIVLDGWRTVVELDASGTERGRHELDLPADAGVTFLRTAAGRDGTRWWLAGRRGGPRAFVFDDRWRLHATVPAAGGGGSAGISTADLADLDGDGTPDVVIGHLGDAGVEAVTLLGGPVWTTRSAAPVVGLAPAAPPVDGMPRQVLAVTGDGRIVRTGSPPPAGDTGTQPAEPPIVLLAGGPVADAGRWALLGIASERVGSQQAVGIDAATLAREWTLPLADGVHRDGPIDPVAWADLLGTPRRQWLIAAPDGSVTMLWADGRVVDRYQHGAPLVGIGGYRHAGRGHVVLATRQGVEAFTVTDVALD